jgi:hypothetical protein
MIKYLLAAILALAIIGGAIRFESNEHSWQLIINKKEALYSVTNGAKRIYNQIKKIVSGADLADSALIILEDS